MTYDSNSRQRGVSYDADGRVTYDRQRRSHTYEAAGRKVRTSESSQASSWGRGVQGPTESGGDDAAVANMPAGGYYTTTSLTLTLTYDGDGLSTKRVQSKRVSTPQYQPVATTGGEYYLRSTAMGGRVITEFDETGRKAVSKVYGWREEEVAEQRLYAGGQQGVVWRHRNPVTGAEVEQDTSNGLTHRREYDPWGLELGDSDPYAFSAEPDYASLSGGSFYREGGNPFDGDGGCQWDGVPVRCETLGAIGRTRQAVGVGVRLQGQEGGGFGMRLGLSREWVQADRSTQGRVLGAEDGTGGGAGPVASPGGYFAWALGGGFFTCKSQDLT